MADPDFNSRHDCEEPGLGESWVILNRDECFLEAATIGEPSVQGGANLISFDSGDMAFLAASGERKQTQATTIPRSDPASGARHITLLDLSPADDLAPPADAAAGVRSKPPSENPNVYINGLPPYFRDEQLMAMVRNFGEVVSVKCFTRQTARASGYGFVLFKTMEAAEKCIETLKKCDLHPSLSKVNKPPRIICNPAPAMALDQMPSTSSLSSVASFDSFTSSGSGSCKSLKDKLAELEDRSSANVYIEGIPLGSDKTTLLELVYPYAIRSSRFITSKVPNSKTLIAFMRMESRDAAESIINRLNGKKVRSWDGIESRIFLRIADTLDQRELRRNESTIRDDSGHPLTIAHATLLNYHALESIAPPTLAAPNRTLVTPPPLSSNFHTNTIYTTTPAPPGTIDIHELLASRRRQLISGNDRHVDPTAFYAPYNMNTCTGNPPAHSAADMVSLSTFMAVMKSQRDILPQFPPQPPLLPIGRNVMAPRRSSVAQTPASSFDSPVSRVLSGNVPLGVRAGQPGPHPEYKPASGSSFQSRTGTGTPTPRDSLDYCRDKSPPAFSPHSAVHARCRTVPSNRHSVASVTRDSSSAGAGAGGGRVQFGVDGGVEGHKRAASTSGPAFGIGGAPGLNRVWLGPREVQVGNLPSATARL